MMPLRKYRINQAVRDFYADVTLLPEDFIQPFFVVEGVNQQQEISTLPGVYRISQDVLLEKIGPLLALGMNKVLLFGVVSPAVKDDCGTEAWNAESLVCRTVKTLKGAFPQLIVLTDVCLCEYTTHGHCGLLLEEEVDNDSTLPLLAKIALSHAAAGADFVAPSAMMDRQVEAIRTLFDSHQVTTKIMAYSAKYASSFYGPFREAAGSAPAFGDRKTYQMDYRTKDQGLWEIKADIDEGADWVMVKPAQSYLDIIYKASVAYPEIPVVAYQVSGEYALIKFAANSGLIDEQQAFKETLTAIKRAGAHYIITYYATEFVQRGL